MDFPLLAVVILFCLCMPENANGEIDCDLGFKQGTEKLLSVRRNERRAKNRADVTWNPLDMLKHPDCYDLESSKLEIKAGGKTEWRASEEDPKWEAKIQKFTVHVKPCLRYQFRITINRKDMGLNRDAFETTSVIELQPLSDDAVLRSKYKPHPPHGFKSMISPHSAELSWKPSDCARKYEIGYTEAGQDEGFETIEKLGSKMTKTISGLKSCTSYIVNIYALLGEDDFGMLEEKIVTKPKRDVLVNHTIQATPSSSAIKVSWATWKNVTCIDEYKIKTCTNSSCCFQEKTITKAPSIPTISHDIEGLLSGTEYTLLIKPVSGHQDLDVKKVKVKTAGAATNAKVECSVPSTFSIPMFKPQQQNGATTLTRPWIVMSFFVLLFLQWL